MLNSVINLLKYPIGVLFFLFLLELGRIFLSISYTIVAHQEHYTNFFIGIALYVLMWFILFRNKIGRWFAILEHEITHTIFALITFHKILEIRANIVQGHMVFFGGKGNWLIDVAPYFFPTLGFIIIGLIHLSSPQYYPILVGILGYTFLHHIHNTLISIHPNQSDLKRAGYLFSVLFLPSANLLMLIIILTQIPNDQIYLNNAFTYLYDLSRYYYWTTLTHLRT